jgi:hypothetical protein
MKTADPDKDDRDDRRKYRELDQQLWEMPADEGHCPSDGMPSAETVLGL